MLRECRPQDVSTNVKEIGGYLQVRSKVQVITNVSRLISVLRIYYETFLFYLRHAIDEKTINIDGVHYALTVSGHNKQGRAVSLPMSQMSEILLGYYFSDLGKTLNINSLNDLLILLNEILETKAIPLIEKLRILNHESKITARRWSEIIRMGNYNIAAKTLHIRQSILLYLLRLKNLDNTDLDPSEDNISNIHNSFRNYSDTLFGVHLHNNHYSDIFIAILNEVDNIIKIPKGCIAQIESLIFHLLSRFIKYNHLFTLYRWETIIEIIEKNKDYLNDTNFDNLIRYCKFDPSLIDFSSMSIELKEPDFSAPPSSIITSISFVLPYTLRSQSSISVKHESSTISFYPVTSLFDDPCFSFLESTDLMIEGLPLSVVSDSIGQVHNSTRVTIELNELYSPDFDIKNGKAIYRDLKRENAKHGGKYYPHKDRIVDILLDLHCNHKMPLEIDERKITSKVISNYFIAYYSGDRKLIHHKLYMITNLDSYQSIKNRYLDSISALILEDADKSFYEFFHKSRINSKRSFLEFCYVLFELTIKKSIEYHNLDKNLWQKSDSSNIPVGERVAYPIIFNELRSICEAKGIFIGQEVVVSSGRVDFYLFYTCEGKPMNVCVELKNAHSAGLQHGIEIQLPLYIKGTGGNHGIYLVLWYKHDHFSEPKKYANISELTSSLMSNTPKRFQIRTMVINCAPKASPSTTDAYERL